MRVSTPETCTAVYTYVINWIQSHLVGQLFNLIHDARTHEYKIIEEGAAIYSTSAWNHATPFSTAKNVSINKQLVCFQSASAFCLGLGRKRAKRHFFISNVSAGNILAVRCRWSGCYWTKQSSNITTNNHVCTKLGRMWKRSWPTLVICLGESGS